MTTQTGFVQSAQEIALDMLHESRDGDVWHIERVGKDLLQMWGPRLFHDNGVSIRQLAETAGVAVEAIHVDLVTFEVTHFKVEPKT